MLFLLANAGLNGCNLTNSAINMDILTHYNTSIDGKYSGHGHLCHTDTLLVYSLFIVDPILCGVLC